MRKSHKQPLKSENGLRKVAEKLHSLFNKELACPTCLSRSTKSGAFNKDSGGKPNSAGEGCRRFKCRSWPTCGKTLSVTDFLALCHKIHPATVDEMLRKIGNSSSVSGMYPTYQYLPTLDYLPIYPTYLSTTTFLIIIIPISLPSYHSPQFSIMCYNSFY